jgi:hypothetical protein
MMGLVNSLSLFLLVSWLLHIFPWQRLIGGLTDLARMTWRDFHYWTVGDCQESV